MDSCFSVCDSGVSYMGVQMDRKKNKKEIKWFPGYDLHMTIGIVIIVGLVMIIKACNG